MQDLQRAIEHVTGPLHKVNKMNEQWKCVYVYSG
jgi:hypothetical protein